jgi:hypothetical protein
MITSTTLSDRLAPRSKWRLWPRWIIANALPGSIACFVGYYLNAGIESSGIPGLFLLGLTISLTWAIVGLAQWLVLRIPLQSPRSWVFTSAVGGLVGTMLGWWISTGWYGMFTSASSPALLAIGVTGAVAGVVLGLAQWRILQDRITNGRGWILASAASGVAGWVVSWGISDKVGFFSASALGWAAGAAITGLALVRLLKE